MGRGVKYYSNIGVGEFIIDSGEILRGDKLLITGPTTGAVYFTASEIRFDLHPVDRAVKGQTISMPIEAKIRKNDKLFRIIPAEQAQKQ